MVAAFALLAEDNVEPQVPSRDEVLARYRHLREISKRHHSEALNLVSQDAILRHARRLGLALGKVLILDDMNQITLGLRSGDSHGFRRPFPRHRSIRQIDTICARLRRGAHA